jgi:hypothetical protein
MPTMSKFLDIYFFKVLYPSHSITFCIYLVDTKLLAELIIYRLILMEDHIINHAFVVPMVAVHSAHPTISLMKANFIARPTILSCLWSKEISVSSRRTQ